MKGTDIALIIFVALISTGISFWVGNMVLGNPDDRTETISYMDVITDSLNEPDKRKTQRLRSSLVSVNLVCTGMKYCSFVMTVKAILLIQLMMTTMMKMKTKMKIMKIKTTKTTKITLETNICF